MKIKKVNASVAILSLLLLFSFTRIQENTAEKDIVTITIREAAVVGFDPSIIISKADNSQDIIDLENNKSTKKAASNADVIRSTISQFVLQGYRIESEVGGDYFKLLILIKE